MAGIDVLIPTCGRRTALAITLTSLFEQSYRDLRIIVSDQSEDLPAAEAPEIQTVVRLLGAHNMQLDFHRHLPRRGMAEQRQFLLELSAAPYVLYLDDDLILKSNVVGRMLHALQEECCGFVGCGAIGLSYLDDIRPAEQRVEFWDGPVLPEEVRPKSPAWERYRLHNAANLFHLQRMLDLPDEAQLRYRVAWVGGCVLYDACKLRSVGGFEFWRELPVDHCGEEVVAQLRLMARYGGCGLLPSGVYHQELPTTVPNRGVNAPEVLDLGY